ncbi:MAG: hypothetical protein ACFFB0_15940 [Promethearchaeota archaeon]
MSKKILVLSALLLTLGSGLIPGGILIADYINNRVANSIDEGLLGIEEEAIPLIEPMIKEKGIPRSLRGIRNTAISEIEPMIKEKGIPQALRGIRDVGISYVEDMVEATFVAVLIETMAVTGGYVSLLGTFVDPIGIDPFFNNETTGVWAYIFWGVSRYHTEQLNFTEDAQNRILFGNSTTISGYIPGIQGFLNDTSTGAGVATFLEQYSASNSSETNELKEIMQENYNCTWYQLTKLYEYVYDYLIEYIIPDVIIANELHVDYMPELAGLTSVNAIAKALFMEQWANGTILGEVQYPGGIDFSEMIEGINETLVGFEVGRITPSNITRKVALALFDDINYTNALTNDTGIEQWITAYTNNTIKDTLMNEFNLTQTQMDMILYWLFEESFKDNVVPELMKLPPPEGIGKSVSEFAKELLLEQWANGTILGEILYPGGIDFSEILEGLDETLVGFEVGRETPSGITLMSASALFDENNYPDALTNDTGIKKWITAYNNDTVKDALMNEFNLTQTQMDMILYWLFEESFQENIVPELMKLPPPDGVGMNITEYARVLFLEQWANGTAEGKILYPHGFPLSLKAGTIYGLEVGYQGLDMSVLPTNISLKSAESLWDISSEFSIVNKRGLSKWLSAVSNPTSDTAAELQSINDLEDDEMNMILSWIPMFRDKVMPYLAQEEMNLPSDSTTYANSIELGMVIPGAIAFCLGLAGVVSNLLVKRKLKLT